MAERVPLKEVAYAAIKNKILTGEYQPGQFLSEKALTEDIGVSRTPIREALERLKKENLVRGVNGRGAFVSEIRIQDVRDLFQVREPLECLAVRLAVQSIPSEGVEEFRNIFLSMESNLKLDGEIDLVPQIKVDRRFHEFIAMHSGNHLLIQFLSDIYNHNERIMALTTRLPIRLRATVKEHLEIVSALLKKDPDAAEDAMRRHLRAGRDSALAITS